MGWCHVLMGGWEYGILFPRASRLHGECSSGIFQPLHLWGTSQMSPGPRANAPQISKWISLSYSLLTFQSAILSLGLWKNNPVVSPLRRKSQCFTALLGPWCPLHWFSKPDIPGSHISSVDSQSEDAWCGHKPFASVGEVPVCWDSSLLYIAPIGVGFFVRLCLCLFPISMWSFYLLLQRAVCLVFASF